MINALRLLFYSLLLLGGMLGISVLIAKFLFGEDAGAGPIVVTLLCVFALTAVLNIIYSNVRHGIKPGSGGDFEGGGDY